MSGILLTKTSTFIIGPVATLLGYLMSGIFTVLNKIGIPNIGLSIIIFTLVIYLCMMPLTIKQQKFSKLQAKMSPELQAITKKYEGKKDNDSMMAMNEEQKEVYKKYGVSPTGSCVQLLIQFPILLALYRVVYNIPAYVPSVRVFFDNVANPLKDQPDFVNKIAELAEGVNMAVDKVDFTNLDKIVDMLYKFTPEKWETLEGLFPQIADVIAVNADKIEQMNSFFGINLASAPFTGFTTISVAWVIPILAGLTQWFSAKMMSSTQTIDPDAPGASMMNSMLITMPLMSVVFCFTLPAAIGIYWVGQGVLQIVQQLAVNSYMDKIDLDEMIKKNVEKMNQKRAKKGLPPAKLNQNATTSLKSIQSQEEKDKLLMEEKMSKRDKQIQESNEFYNSDPKPGSIASKARMVQKFNEKHK